MKDPISDLQIAIIQRLQTDDAVKERIAGRIYDRVPQEVIFPYLSVGPSNQVIAATDCFDLSDINMQLDVWSRQPGFYEARQIASEVISALCKRPLQLIDNVLASFELVINRSLRDPDGLTSHSVLTFAATIELEN